MSIEETAAALNIPAATVKARLHRANHQLRETLEASWLRRWRVCCPSRGQAVTVLRASSWNDLRKYGPRPICAADGARGRRERAADDRAASQPSRWQEAPALDRKLISDNAKARECDMLGFLWVIFSRRAARAANRGQAVGDSDRHATASPTQPRRSHRQTGGHASRARKRRVDQGRPLQLSQAATVMAKPSNAMCAALKFLPIPG
jgi:hypothetical protein